MKSNVTIKDLKLFLKDILVIDLENLKPNESVTAKVGFYNKTSNKYDFYNFDILGCENKYKLCEALNAYSPDGYYYPNYLQIKYDFNLNNKHYIKIFDVNETNCKMVTKVERDDNNEILDYTSDDNNEILNYTTNLQDYFIGSVKNYCDFLVKYNDDYLRIFTKITEIMVKAESEKLDKLSSDDILKQKEIQRRIIQLERNAEIKTATLIHSSANAIYHKE